MKKETWKLLIQMLISVLTAIATTLGVTSCMAL
ncbi:smalltalk protein [Prevotella sp. KH2C16]|nr:smalltalk protein [Prevotella sp. KH2C16]